MQSILLLLVVLVGVAQAARHQCGPSTGKFHSRADVEPERTKILNKNKEFVEQFNALNSTRAGFKLGLNHLSDRSSDEIKRVKCPMVPANVHSHPSSKNKPEAAAFIQRILSDTTEVPLDVDWRNVSGRVWPAQDQGLKCRACWAFVAAGLLEGLGKSGSELSKQSLIDCSPGNQGCEGGDVEKALEFVASQGGIVADNSYPYKGAKSECQSKQATMVPMKIAGSVYLPNTGYTVEETLQRVVARVGPVAVGINSRDNTFLHYKSGIHRSRTCSSKLEDLDHTVLVVGYGWAGPKQGDYWIIKNSWGKDWGEDGFGRMARGWSNHCGIATVALIPYWNSNTHSIKCDGGFAEDTDR